MTGRKNGLSGNIGFRSNIIFDAYAKNTTKISIVVVESISFPPIFGKTGNGMDRTINTSNFSSGELSATLKKIRIATTAINNLKNIRVSDLTKSLLITYDAIKTMNNCSILLAFILNISLAISNAVQEYY